LLFLKKWNRVAVLVLQIDRSVIIVDEMAMLVGMRKLLPLLRVVRFDEDDPASVVGIEKSGQCRIAVECCGFKRANTS
jgi:hypothetical protein